MLMVEQATGCLTAARTASGSAHPLRGYPPFQPRVAVGGELPPPPARLVVVAFGRSPAPRVPAPGSERTAPLLPPLSSQRQSAAWKMPAERASFDRPRSSPRVPACGWGA